MQRTQNLLIKIINHGHKHAFGHLKPGSLFRRQIPVLPYPDGFIGKVAVGGMKKPYLARSRSSNKKIGRHSWLHFDQTAEIKYSSSWVAGKYDALPWSSRTQPGIRAKRAANANVGYLMAAPCRAR
jgi:hypothetical protein